MDSFDAYYHWLGIPPEEQPPDHYRLLGLRRFEDNPTVISHAADRQMAHLRTFQTGRHSAESQRLLNETAAARVCLLNPDKKAAYDERLRRETQSVSEGASTSGEAAPSESSPRFEPVSDLAPDVYALASARRRRSRRFVTVAALVVLTAGLGVLAWAVFRPSPLSDRPVGHQASPSTTPVQPPANQPLPAAPSSTTPEQPPREPPHPSAEPAAPESAKPPAPSASPPSRHDEPKTPEPPPSVVAAPPAQPSNPVTAPPQSPPAQPAPRPEPIERPNIEEPTEPAEAPQTPVPPPASFPNGLAKNPVPPPDVQERIARDLNQIYTFSAVRTPAETDALIAELLKHGERLEGTSDERFVVLRKAVEVAAAAGRTDPLLQAIELLDKHYEIDPWDLRQSTFRQMAAEVKGPGAARALLASLEGVTQDALDADRYAAAEELAKAGNRASMEAGDAALRKRWRDAYAAATRLRRRADRIREVEKHLETSPGDLSAHDELGQWYCFEREDWRRGLPHLADGTNAALAELAEQELRHRPTTVDEQLKLADAWWDFAAKARKNHRSAIRRRAGYWYRRAEPELSGVAKLKVEKRLAELAHESNRQGAKPRPKRSYRCRFAAMADDQFEMYVNGQPFMNGQQSQTVVSQIGPLASGDIITVRAINAGGRRGFACAILSEHGDLLFTGPAWRSYDPKSPERWYEPDQIDAVRPVTAGIVSLAQRFFQQTRVRAASIWGAQSVCYLVYQVP